jgi:hypothetical protein
MTSSIKRLVDILRLCTIHIKMSRASTFPLFDFSFLFSLHAIQATSTRMMTNPATPQALRHPPLIPHNIADLIQTSSNQSPHISARHALSKERVRQTSRMIALRLPQFLANGASSLNHLARISHEAVDIFANALFADIVRYAQSHNILQHKKCVLHTAMPWVAARHDILSLFAD